MRAHARACKIYPVPLYFAAAVAAFVTYAPAGAILRESTSLKLFSREFITAAQ